MKPVRVLASARADIEREHARYQDIYPALGVRFIDATKRAFDAIQQNPLAMEVRRYGVRRWSLRGFPHGVLYRVLEAEILILAVFHPRRAPESWMPGVKERR